MTAITIPDDLQQHLQEHAARTGKTWDAVALEALQEYLEDQADIDEAQARLAEPDTTRSLEEVRLGLGL